MDGTQLKDDRGLKRSPIWWLIERELAFGRLRCLLILPVLSVAVPVAGGLGRGTRYPCLPALPLIRLCAPNHQIAPIITNNVSKICPPQWGNSDKPVWPSGHQWTNGTWSRKIWFEQNEEKQQNKNRTNILFSLFMSFMIWCKRIKNLNFLSILYHLFAVCLNSGMKRGFCVQNSFYVSSKVL